MIINTQMTKKGSSSKPVLIGAYIETTSNGSMGSMSNPYLTVSIEHTLDDSGPIIYAPPVNKGSMPVSNANRYYTTSTTITLYGSDLPNGRYSLYVITLGGTTAVKIFGTIAFDYNDGVISNIDDSALFKTVSGTTTHYVDIVDVTYTSS